MVNNIAMVYLWLLWATSNSDGMLKSELGQLETRKAFSLFQAPGCPRLVLRGGRSSANQTTSDEQAFEEFIWSKSFVDQGLDPLFMDGLTEEEAERARNEWLHAIMEGEENEEEAAEYHRDLGNKAVASALESKVLHCAVQELFQRAAEVFLVKLLPLRVTHKFRAACFSNRALCHLQRGNFGNVIRDCNATLAMFEAFVASTAKHPRRRRGAESQKQMFPMTRLLALRPVRLNRTDVKTLVKLSVKSCVRAARACLGLKR
eukprot:748255-Hanusia_phi.AAC.4